MTPTALAASPVTAAAVRTMRGVDVIVETVSGAMQAQLLSFVKDSAWFVSGDTDVVVHLHDITSIRVA
jgi:hypothetical protein